MTQYKATLEESREYLETLIERICALLDENGIDYTLNTSTIIIPKKDRKEISSLIRTLPIPKGVLFFALDICQIKDAVYVRKKVK